MALHEVTFLLTDSEGERYTALCLTFAVSDFTGGAKALHGRIKCCRHRMQDRDFPRLAWWRAFKVRHPISCFSVSLIELVNGVVM